MTKKIFVYVKSVFLPQRWFSKFNGLSLIEVSAVYSYNQLDDSHLGLKAILKLGLIPVSAGLQCPYFSLCVILLDIWEHVHSFSLKTIQWLGTLILLYSPNFLLEMKKEKRGREGVRKNEGRNGGKGKGRAGREKEGLSPCRSMSKT